MSAQQWIRQTEDYIRRNRIFEPGERLIVGVSGGVDSVCLLEVLCVLAVDWQWQIRVVHINHGIRGASADQDQQFVEDLCAGENVPCQSVRVDVPKEARARGIGEEECGRILRREIFERVRTEQQADKIVLAHHRDDSVETILFNLCRGTGIRGLAGIRPVDGVYARPLLWSSRSQIEAFAAEVGLDHCEDETNAQTQYMRNRIRLEVLPLLTERVNAQTSEHIERTGKELATIDAYLEEQTDSLWERYVNKRDEQIVIGEGVKAEPAVLTSRLVRRVLTGAAQHVREIGSVHIEAVCDLLDKPAGKQVSLPNGLVCERTTEGLLIRPADSAEQTATPAAGYTFQSRLVTPGETLDLAGDPYTKYFDYGIIGENCAWRTRQSGDYLVIHADGGRQSLQDWFINQKIPAQERDNVMLLADGHHVYWVVGYRQAEDCLITDHTETIIEWRAIRDDG